MLRSYFRGNINLRFNSKLKKIINQQFLKIGTITRYWLRNVSFWASDECDKRNLCINFSDLSLTKCLYLIKFKSHFISIKPSSN